MEQLRHRTIPQREKSNICTIFQITLAFQFFKNTSVCIHMLISFCVMDGNISVTVPIIEKASADKKNVRHLSSTAQSGTYLHKFATTYLKMCFDWEIIWFLKGSLSYDSKDKESFRPWVVIGKLIGEVLDGVQMLAYRTQHCKIILQKMRQLMYLM